MNQIISKFQQELLDVAHYAKDTVTNYLSCINRFLDYCSTQWSIHPYEVKASHLKDWMAVVKKSGVSNSRLTHHSAAIKHFYSFLCKMNYISNNPALALFPIRRTKSDLNQPISTEAACKLLNAVDRSSWIGERDFIILSCLWALGIRRQELVVIKVDDLNIDFDPQQKIGLLKVHGKGNKERALFVVDKLYENLIDYLKHPKSPGQKDQPLFPSKTGSFMNGDAVGKIVRKFAHKARIQQRVTPHVLRHTFATDMYLHNVPPEDIQAMIGHDSIEETSGYIHIPMELKQQALQQLTITGGVHGC